MSGAPPRRESAFAVRATRRSAETRYSDKPKAARRIGAHTVLRTAAPMRIHARTPALQQSKRSHSRLCHQIFLEIALETPAVRPHVGPQPHVDAKHETVAVTSFCMRSRSVEPAKFVIAECAGEVSAMVSPSSSFTKIGDIEETFNSPPPTSHADHQLSSCAASSDGTPCRAANSRAVKAPQIEPHSASAVLVATTSPTRRGRLRRARSVSAAQPARRPRYARRCLHHGPLPDRSQRIAQRAQSSIEPMLHSADPTAFLA